jgi:hypothetical protein
LVSGVVAAVLVTAGVLVVNGVTGQGVHAGQVWSFLVPSLSLTLFLSAVLLPALMAPLSSMVRRGPSGAVVVAALCVAALAASMAVLPARTLLVGEHPLETPTAGTAVPQTELTDEASRRAVMRYLDQVASPLAQGADAGNTALTTILGNQELTPAEAVERLHAEVLAPTRELLADFGGYSSGLDALDEAHQEAVTALRTRMEKVRVIVDYLRHGDQALVERAGALRDEEDQHWGAWSDKLQKLTDQFTS